MLHNQYYHISLLLKNGIQGYAMPDHVLGCHMATG